MESFETATDRFKEIESFTSVHRNLRPIEIMDFDNEGNVYLEGQRRSAMEVMTPQGGVLRSQHLPNPGFSVTEGMVVNDFGSHVVRISVKDIKSLGGKIHPTDTGRDYFYVEVPERAKVKSKLIVGDITLTKLGALANILASDKRDMRYVIAPVVDNNPVKSGFRLSSGEVGITYFKNGKKIKIEKIDDELIKAPRLFHSLMLTVLFANGVSMNKFDVREIELPNGTKIPTQKYLKETWIRRVKNNPQNLKINL